MPEYLNPGVYVEEVHPSAHTIEGVSTSIAAFVGYTQHGPDNTPTTVYSASDFERIFGLPTADTELAFAVDHYFANGGSQAVIVRTPARYANLTDVRFFSIDCGDPAVGMLTFTALSSGDRPNNQLTLAADRLGIPATEPASSFRLQIKNALDSSVESFYVSLDATSDRYIATILNDAVNGSQFFRVRVSLPATLPDPLDLISKQQPTLAATPEGPSGTAELLGDRTAQTGIYALLQAEDINLLCLPDATRPDPAKPACPDPVVDTAAIYTAAVALCEERGIFLLVDPPVNVVSVRDAEQWVATLQQPSSNAAVYFPRIVAADPLPKVIPSQPAPTRIVAPSVFVAGVYARTDSNRGVWKAPAGMEARLTGVLDLATHLNDNDNSALNAVAVNCLRSLPPYGPVVWGSRTLAGSAVSGSQWRYVPVLRLGLFLERSIERGTMWAVFEPNGEPLWAAVRVAVDNFLQKLFHAGAFQGTTPKEAYFVQCGLHQTMTQNDVDEGNLIVEVGFAPLKPAEFVILRFTQMSASSN